MKKILLGLVMIFVLPNVAQATVLDFEGITGSLGYIPSDYAGLNWGPNIDQQVLNLDFYHNLGPGFEFYQGVIATSGSSVLARSNIKLS